MAPPLVLDANAFAARGFRRWLRDYHGSKVIPAVAYAEIGVHQLRLLTSEGFDAMLGDAGVQVEWLTKDLARLACELGLARGDWAEQARDYLVGAHALAPPRLFVTDNLVDFDFLEGRVRAPHDVMAHPPR